MAAGEPVTRVRKWLGSSITLSLRRGELLAIVAAAIIINAFWPGVPTWAFFVFGAAISVADRAGRATGRHLGRWLRQKSTT